MPSSPMIPAAVQVSRLHLPGLNLPLNFIPQPAHRVGEYVKNEIFPSALDPIQGGSLLTVTTLRELAMLQLMNHLTDKPEWEKKIFDKTIVTKWGAEALNEDEGKISPLMLQWVLAELRYKAKIFEKTGAVSVYNGDVVKSDSAISSSLRQALNAAVKPLEDVSEVHKDYHPGSDGKVIDLVHPSLFPLIYGRTRVLSDSLIRLEDCVQKTGLGNSIQIPPENQIRTGREPSYSINQSPHYSRNFQWLPCEVDFTGPGDDVKITSYINNLHPQKFGDLYALIEQIISRAIPLWNLTLTPLKGKEYHFERILYYTPRYDPDPDDLPKEERLQQRPDESEDDFYDREQEWMDDFRAEHVLLPEPKEFSPPLKSILTTGEDGKTHGVDLKRDFSSRGLQVIVKLASIVLTPEKPSYEGGTWHVEGQLNEHICATALYYYDNDNITESRLAFRQHFSDDDTAEIGYAQNEHAWAEPVFGLVNENPAVQDVGDILCKEGRLLTFPNVLQHQVRPFQLEDPSRSGHRKILALFLVDPNIRVISTANVPPQQRDWWSEEVLSTGCFDRLAKELQDNMFESVDDFPIGLSEAKEIRERLMEERAQFAVSQNEGFESYTFSLCEH